MRFYMIQPLLSHFLQLSPHSPSHQLHSFPSVPLELSELIPASGFCTCSSSCLQHSSPILAWIACSPIPVIPQCRLLRKTVHYNRHSLSHDSIFSVPTFIAIWDCFICFMYFCVSNLFLLLDHECHKGKVQFAGSPAPTTEPGHGRCSRICIKYTLLLYARHCARVWGFRDEHKTKSVPSSWIGQWPSPWGACHRDNQLLTTLSLRMARPPLCTQRSFFQCTPLLTLPGLLVSVDDLFLYLTEKTEARPGTHALSSSSLPFCPFCLPFWEECGLCIQADMSANSGSVSDFGQIT